MILLPIPKKELEPLTLPHAAIRGFTTIGTTIHCLLGDVFWNALPGVLRGLLEPLKAGISRVLRLVSIFTRFWRVYWQLKHDANHHACRLWLTVFVF